MSVSSRQFNLLNEMGITLWQRRESLGVNDAAVQTENIDFAMLSKNPLFINIIQSIGLSIGEVSCVDHKVNLGFINWQFSQQNIISLVDNILTSPNMEIIRSSAQLKRELWQVIQEQGLS